MGPVKYSLFSAIHDIVVGRPHGDMYHTRKYLLHKNVGQTVSDAMIFQMVSRIVT